MRYKWIELYNYAGIYNGMGLTQIKIDFTQCKTNKIIIKGSNGSGKSTLIKAINLNHDSNDNFIPTCEARKNICITDKGIDYIIRYIHPVTSNGRGTTKGYISKMINGQLTELNPNGNITSCENIIYEEFGLDSNFMALSSLSSENRGLVDSKPAERKKLINSIISTLDVYNNIYKNLNKKAAVYSKLISGLVTRIDYLGNEAQLNAKLNNIEGRLNVLEGEKTTTIEAIASVRLRISEYANILKENNYDAIVSELKDISLHVKTLKSKILKKASSYGINNLDSIEHFYNHIDKRISAEEVAIQYTKDIISRLLSERELEFRDLQAKKEKLHSLESEYNYLDLKKAINKIKRTISEYDKTFSAAGITDADLLTKAEFDIAINSLGILRDMANDIMVNYSPDTIGYAIRNLDVLGDKLSGLTESQNILNIYRSEFAKVEAEIGIYRSKASLISELDNRPDNCTIDTCPYIKVALEASKQYPIERLEELYTDARHLKELISIEEDKYNKSLKYKDIVEKIKTLKRELSIRMPAISKLPMRYDFESTFLERVANLDSFNDIDKIYMYIDCGNMLEEYKVAKMQLAEYKTEYAIYEAKNDVFEAILKNITELTEKTDNAMRRIDTLNNEVQESQKKVEDLKQAKKAVGDLLIKLKDDLKPSEVREAELIKIKETLDINSTEINILQKQMDQLNTNFGAVNSDINTLTEERDKVKHSLIQLAEYKEDLECYNQAYSKINKIKYYSSPSTGIQTLFMQLYMNKIISTANNLLNMLFEGEFVLQPFIINESEFKIPCLGHGLIHDDISSMSTAQKCMISMILSFSILHQSSTRYNVISLDELDGGLDTMNRGFFIELLDRLMGMLQCEQCFIISHNNELNTSSADLILLKNNSGDIYDGNVIWQY